MLYATECSGYILICLEDMFTNVLLFLENCKYGTFSGEAWDRLRKMRYKPHRKYKMTECQNVNDGRC